MKSKLKFIVPLTVLILLGGVYKFALAKPPVKEKHKIKAKGDDDDKKKKEAKKEARKADKVVRPVVPGEDPDIAGIIPGPQPIPEDF